ncbi:MAG: type I methionyl aminopeptidase [Fimbriimonadaceae bacterium]|nr:type I methionyl aminopeptidase [Fimbriimonadaceae bacterium]
MIVLKRSNELDLMREGGKILAATMREVSGAIVPGKTSPKMLDEIARKKIQGSGAEPSFLGYKGFPASACISVNDVVVHGIPDDTPLQEGDIVGLDFGVYYKGFHTDSAWTFPVGKISANAQRLLNVTRESLYQGIAQAKVGNMVGDISHTVQKYVESMGYGVVRDLVGHGIGKRLHEEPSVPNFGKPKRGERLRAGMTMCIEPMVNEGTWRVTTDSDGWTMRTEDGKLSAHFEHTVAILPEGPEILTTDDEGLL